MIVIKDKKVSIYSEEAIEKEISFEDFMSSLQKNVPIEIPFLPENTRGFYSENGKTMFVIEVPPCARDVAFKWGSLSHVFFLRWPWTYFVVSVQNNPICLDSSNFRIFYSKTRVVDEKTELCWMTTPNALYDPRVFSGHICHGEIRVADNQNIFNFANEMIQQFFGSFFNKDHMDHSHFGLSAVTEKMSVIRPIIEENLKTAKGTLKTMLTSALSGDYSGYLQYMYAWELVSNELSTNFAEKAGFHNAGTYKDMLGVIRKGLGS